MFVMNNILHKVNGYFGVFFIDKINLQSQDKCPYIQLAIKHNSAPQSAAASILKQIHVAECCLVKWLPGYSKWRKIRDMSTKIFYNINGKIKWMKTKLQGRLFVSRLFKILKDSIPCAHRIVGSQTAGSHWTV